MLDFPLMAACAVSLVGGGMFVWREQQQSHESPRDRQQAMLLLGLVSALIMASCVLDFSQLTR